MCILYRADTHSRLDIKIRHLCILYRTNTHSRLEIKYVTCVSCMAFKWNCILCFLYGILNALFSFPVWSWNILFWNAIMFRFLRDWSSKYHYFFSYEVAFRHFHFLYNMYITFVSCTVLKYVFVLFSMVLEIIFEWLSLVSVSYVVSDNEAFVR